MADAVALSDRELGDVCSILGATLAIFTALLFVPFVDRGEEHHPLRRLPVVISAGAAVLFVIGMIAYALVTPVATHIE